MSGSSRLNAIKVDDDTEQHHSGRSQIEDKDLTWPPVFYDTKLRCMMYGGPGYEDYPAAYESNPTFREAYREWERQSAERRRRDADIQSQTKPQVQLQPFIVDADDPPDLPDLTSGNYAQPDVIRKVSDVTPLGERLQGFEDACLAQALQIFPNIAHDFVRQKYQNWNQRQIPSDIDPDIVELVGDGTADVIAEIAELETYPEQCNKRKRTASGGEATEGHLEWGQNSETPTTKTYFYDGCAHISFPPTLTPALTTILG